MNSGKSTLLINAAYNYEETGKHVATIKPLIDTKGDNFIVARAGLKREVDIVAPKELNLRTAVEHLIGERAVSHLSAVLVDEAQFLQPEQIDNLFEVAKLDDISVIAYGLRTDFRTDLFPGSRRLLELADLLEEMPTMCRCENQARFNCRIEDGKFVFEGEQVAIDGVDVTYQSLCATCYLTEKAKAAAE